MFKSQRWFFVFFKTWVWLSIAASVPVFTAHAQTESKHIDFGTIDRNPRYVIDAFTPFLDYLRTQGIPTGKVRVYRSAEQAIKRLNAGEYSISALSPSNALRLMDEANAKPLLIFMKGGVKQYNSAIFVKKESSVTSLAELTGKVIAFEHPYSTSSYFLPRNVLLESKLTLQESRKAVNDAVAYYFSKDDANTVAQVNSGIAHAGGIQKAFLEKHPDFSKFRIVAESPYVPRIVFLISGDFPEQPLKRILLDMHNHADGQAVLKNMRTTRIVEFDGDPVETMNTTVRTALK